MIPKRIHYCWFGGKEVPDSVKKCIESWKIYCSEYEIKRWDETNFDIHSHPYMKEAYDAKKWAFVSDLARLMIIYDHGGIYLDTDVELINKLDPVLDNTFFLATEKDTNERTQNTYVGIATGLGFGAEKGNKVIKAMLDEYKGIHFVNGTDMDLTPCPIRNTEAIKQYGYINENKLQKLEGGTIYPADFFCPEECSSKVKNYSENTLSIHHYGATWKSRNEKFFYETKKELRHLLGVLRKK
jgi:hypothetical protein